MKRAPLPFFLLVGAWAWTACTFDAPASDHQLQSGKELYGQFCSLCHGKEGEGYAADAANALSNQDFLAIADDAFMRSAIKRGRPGTPMSAWGLEHNGPLDYVEVDAIVAWIRHWQEEESIELPEVEIDGDATRGEPIYEVHCATCHGARGNGGQFMSISNPNFLANIRDEYLQHTITKGRAGTAMTAYESTITPQGIDDLVVLIRSWQEEVSETLRVQRVTQLVDVVLNPGGITPAFAPGERYVGVDEVYGELERGAAMVLVDARPRSDYLLEHIAGAVNVPFYDAEDFVDQLPKDYWIVVYCACPHAESGQVADLLEEKGFTLVKVLDEGFYEWKARGYPVTAQREE